MVREIKIWVVLLIFLVMLCACFGYPTIEDDGSVIKTPEDAWNFYPGFKDQVNAVGDVFYDNDGKNTILSKKAIELCALVTARYWSSGMSWSNHAQSAMNAGLSNDIIEAVRNWQSPEFNGDEELEATYQFSTEILTTKNVSDMTYMLVRDIWGKRGPLELSTLLSHECMVVFTIKAFRLKPDEPVDLPSGSWIVEKDVTETHATGRAAKLGYPFATSDVYAKNKAIWWAENILGLTFLPHRADHLHEFCILLTARYWNCLLPWFAHVQPARVAGVKREAIQKLGVFENPEPYLSDDEKAIWAFCQVLLNHNLEMDEATYSKAVSLVGRPVLVKLVTAVGYYTEISVVANTLGYTGLKSNKYPFPVD